MRAPLVARPALRIVGASLQRYALPLAAPTTASPDPRTEPAADPDDLSSARWRRGLLLRVRVAAEGGAEACGIGEVAPLPGEG